MAWLGSNIQIVLLGVLGLVAVSWAHEAAEEADDALEATKAFGGRAKEGTGGALNLTLALVGSVLGWGVTTFSTAGEFVGFLAGLAPSVPVITASVFTISLGSIGLAGVVVIKWWHFALIASAAVVLSYAYRADLSAEGDLG